MTAGTLPLGGRTNARAERRDSSRGRCRSLYRPMFPAGLRLTILRCLSKQPVQRYRHPREVAAALQTSGEDSAVPATKRSGRQPTSSTSARLAVSSGAGQLPLVDSGCGGTFSIGDQHGLVVPATGSACSGNEPSSRELATTRIRRGKLLARRHDDRVPEWRRLGRSRAAVDQEPRARGPFTDHILRGRGRTTLLVAKGDQILFNRRGEIWSVPPLGGQPRPLIQPGSNPSFRATASTSCTKRQIGEYR